MINKILDTVKKYNMISPGDSVLVALSGGADSMALLHALLEFKNKLCIERLEAAHLNHMIRGTEADRDEEHVKQACASLGIKLYVKRADIPKICSATGEGCEECGRRLRYEFFSQCADGAKVATAHNQNDNAETMIINLLRGTGLRGLCGIPPVRGNIIRPLLDCSRAEIEKYCALKGIEYVTDSTNSSNDYLRNRVRHKILPLFEELNPAALGNMLLASRHNRADEEFISGECRKIIKKIATDKDTLANGTEISSFADVNEVLLTRILRDAAKAECGVSVSARQVEALLQMLRKGSGTADIGDGYSACVRGGRLYFENYQQRDPFCVKVDLSSSAFEAHGVSIFVRDNTEYPDIKKVNKKLLYSLLDYDKIGSNIYLRSRKEGDKITLCGRNVTKSLKKLFNEAGIPPKLRNGIPVLADDERVLWVPDFGADKSILADENTKKVMVVQYGGKPAWKMPSKG